MNVLESKLSAIGAHEVIYRSSLGRELTVKPWTPTEPWNGEDATGTFFLRYHHYNKALGETLSQTPDLYSAGQVVEEGPIGGDPASWDPAVLKVLRDWIGDSTWTPTLQDKMDLKLVKDPSVMDAVFNTDILPLIRQATGAAPQSGGDTATTDPSTTPLAGKVATAGGAASSEGASAALVRHVLADLKKLKISVQGHGGKPMREIEHQLDRIISGLGG